jgi:tetratricopeptide (TPR) repeat protein
MKWAKTRWFLAACSLLLSVKMMVTGLLSGGIAAAFPVLISLASFIGTVLLIAPETAFRLAEWCSRPFVAILFPSDHFNKPPLSYRLARRYRDEKRWEDAARQYRKIIRYYPKEADAYLELLHVAAQMGDHKTEHKYGALFRKRFKTAAPQTS